MRIGITHIDKTYRTSDDRIIDGWEFAGAYAIQSLISKPNFFDGHIATSPYPIHQTCFADTNRLQQLESKLTGALKSQLYFRSALAKSWWRMAQSYSING